MKGARSMKRFLSLALSLLLSVSLVMPVSAVEWEDDSELGYYDETGDFIPYYTGKISYVIHGNMVHNGEETLIARSFAIASRTFRGDETGELNWGDKLTRAQAAVVLVQLMGLEEEAKAAAQAPSPFTDVPAWANGYVNVAYEKGVVKGMDSQHFGSDQTCGIKDFITMLFRLTHLEEGKDFSWETSLDDFKAAAAGVDELSTSIGWSAHNISYASCGVDIYDYAVWAKGPLTRAAAADIIYTMLSIEAGPEQESLADILAVEYGMDDVVFYDNYVRRTGYGLPAGDSITFPRVALASPVTLTVRGGLLSVESPAGWEVTLSTEDEGVSFQGGLSKGQPFPLPQQDFVLTVRVRAGDGSPIYKAGAETYAVYIYYEDGAWSISRWDRNEKNAAYLHAYLVRIEEYLNAFRDPEYLDQLKSGEAGALESQEIRDLAAQITAGKQTELEKARAISDWVATHIYYDYPSRGAGNIAIIMEGPEVTLQRRKGICQNYSTLVGALMCAAGLECYADEGDAGGPHAWNMAYLDGAWVMIDATFDSPLTYGMNNPDEYLCIYSDPELIFIKRVPDNIMEPNASVISTPRWFGQDSREFYRTHQKEPNPLLIHEATTNVHYVGY